MHDKDVRGKMEKKTKEPQYRILIELQEKLGTAQFGLMSNFVWQEDPKRLLFVLSRYKFTAKMLSGRKNVLEVGCADAFFTRVVKQEVGKLTAVDFDPLFIEDAKKHLNERWNFDCKVHDILKGPVAGKFDGIYSIDVIEHIKKSDEDKYMSNMVSSLTDDGVLIIGTPSLQSQAYASDASKEGHVNCKDHKELKQLMLKYFDSVFIFSMNDEVVHTGFYPMANYLFALCCGKKK
jgi:2-polyprenyl-3-methyl-5-hydroxy-6-metoxy-1,4-benzoquinol methylase